MAAEQISYEKEPIGEGSALYQDRWGSSERQVNCLPLTLDISGLEDERAYKTVVNAMIATPRRSGIKYDLRYDHINLLFTLLIRIRPDWRDINTDRLSYRQTDG